MRLKMAEVKGKSALQLRKREDGVKLPLFPSEPTDTTVSQPYDYVPQASRGSIQALLYPMIHRLTLAQHEGCVELRSCEEPRVVKNREIETSCSPPGANLPSQQGPEPHAV